MLIDCELIDVEVPISSNVSLYSIFALFFKFVPLSIRINVLNVFFKLVHCLKKKLHRLIRLEHLKWFNVLNFAGLIIIFVNTITSHGNQNLDLLEPLIPHQFMDKVANLPLLFIFIVRHVHVSFIYNNQRVTIGQLGPQGVLLFLAQGILVYELEDVVDERVRLIAVYENDSILKMAPVTKMDCCLEQELGFTDAVLILLHYHNLSRVIVKVLQDILETIHLFRVSIS